MFGHQWASLWGTSLTAQAWVYSSQALTMPSGLPDALVGHDNGRGCKGTVEHLGVVAHLDCLSSCQVSILRPLGNVNINKLL